MKQFFTHLLSIHQSPNTLDGDNHSPAIKEEDDDDDDEAEDRIDSQVHDPERLKAFNVRETASV